MQYYMYFIIPKKTKMQNNARKISVFKIKEF